MKPNFLRDLQRFGFKRRQGREVTANRMSSRTARRVLASAIIVLVVILTSVGFVIRGAVASSNVQSQKNVAASNPCPFEMFSDTPPPTCASNSSSTAPKTTNKAAVAPLAAVTTGFTDTVVFSGLDTPTGVRFAPDGRVFVTEKSGLILDYDNVDANTPTVFADLRGEVDDFWDRGLMGVAIDPNFPASPYIYAYFSYDAPIGGTAPKWHDACPTPPGATTDGCVISGRLVRLTFDPGTKKMVPGSEKVILKDQWCQQFPSHSNDTVLFGPDGALYLTAGDGASFDNVDYGQYGNAYAGDKRNPCGDPPAGVNGVESSPTAEGGALRAQSFRRPSSQNAVLNGTLIRIDPNTGLGLSNNPNHASSDPNRKRIDAYGLRNPFRFTFRPSTNEIWVGDVGWNTWEEIDRIMSPTAPSLNFGWPCYEGNNPQGSYQSAGLNLCKGITLTKPYYTYQHGAHVVTGEPCKSSGASISGITFYSGSSYPTAYHGALFFADYTRTCIWAMPLGSNGQPDPTKITVVDSSVHPVDLEVGPGGDVYYADLSAGQIRRLQANEPNAVAKADVTQGPAPLTVNFDGSDSTSPNSSAPLTYAWDLDNDGQFDDANTATATHTFSIEGRYTVRLKVTDSLGVSGISDPLIIQVGQLPVATIASPDSTLKWKVGDQIDFSGSAIDGHDGTTPLPPSSLTWSLMLHHCVKDTTDCHLHFLQTFAGVDSGTFFAPDHQYPSYLELQLTATDPNTCVTPTDPSTCLQAITSVRLDPQTVTLSFDSTPTGGQISIDGFTGAAPFDYDVIVGSTNTIGVAAQQTIDSGLYVFASWSDGGAQSHDVQVGNTPLSFNVALSRVPTEASKLTLADTSPVSPALWTSGSAPPAGAPAAVISWLGGDAAHHLNIERSADGLTYTNKITLGDTSTTTPSVLVVNSNIVVIAWIGTDAAHHINVMYDAYGARQKLTLGETTTFAPSLTFYNGQVWLAWTGTNSTHSLNVMAMGPKGIVAGTKKTLASFGSLAGPTLTSDPIGNQLLLTWSQSVAPMNINLATSTDGVNWTQPAGQPSAQASLVTPDVLALSTKPSNGFTYYWTWAASAGSHSLSLMHADDLTAWSPATAFIETAVGGPQLGFTGTSGAMILVWTGTDAAHHLNIASIQN